MSQLKKYRRLKYLGKGSYGAAILVELRSNASQRFVIKEIVIGHLKPAEQASAKAEAEVLHQMNHSNITMYIESFVENEKLYIVMENADGGDLSGAIQSRKKDAKLWDEEEVMRIFVQICLALKHVHNQNILHRDLKSQNIFLTSKGVVKLGDFGIAKVLDATDDQARTQIGTPYYLSPEICESKPYGRESDVWSLGVLLYELLALEMPFQATSLPALVHRICAAEPDYSGVEKRYSASILGLVRSMLMKDPQQRPSLSQLVRHDFIKTHISRLLSYTLKVGTGGVEGPGPTKRDSLDPEEAERQIESVHQVTRDEESREVRGQMREAQRIAEREKLRKFRSDMARGKDKDGGSDFSDKDDERGGAGGARNATPPTERRDRDSKESPSVPLIPSQEKPLTPSSLAVFQQRERDRKVEAASAMRAEMQNPYQRRAPQVAPQVQVQVRGQAGGSYESAARREFFANRAAAQAVKAKVEAYDKVGAQAGGQVTGQGQGQGSNPPSRRNSDATDEDYDYSRRGGDRDRDRDSRDSRDNRDRDRDGRDRAFSDRDGRDREGDGRDRRYSQGEDLSPQERIARIKADRERERDLQNASKEAELNRFLEANRAARSSAKAAVAFEIDLSGEVRSSGESGDGARVREPPARLQLQRAQSQRSVGSGGGSGKGEGRGEGKEDGGRQKRGWGPPVALDIAKGVLRYTDLSPKSPVVPVGGVGGALSMFDSEGESHEGDGYGLGRAASRDSLDGISSTPGAGAGAGAGVVGTPSDMKVLRRLETRRTAQLEARQQAKEIFKQLREKRRTEAEGKAKKPPRPAGAGAGAGMGAGVGVGAVGTAGAAGSGAGGSKVVVRHEVVSPVKRVPRYDTNAAAEGQREQRDPSPQARLMQVLGQVDAASAVARSLGVPKEGARAQAPPWHTPASAPVPASAPAAADAKEEAKSSPAREGANRSDVDVKSVRDLDAHMPMGDDYDDLEYTLDDFLARQKRGGTPLDRGDRGDRDRPRSGRSAKEVVAEEEGLQGYSTVRHALPPSQFDSHAQAKEEDVADDAYLYVSGEDMFNTRGRDHKAPDSAQGAAYGAVDEEEGDVVRGKYNGNDVEVVGLQCMLAQALMGEDEE